MFTGIIQAVGRIAVVEDRGVDRRVKIDTGKLGLSDAQLGDSIAVNGVCLTAVELGGGVFAADVSGETLSRTTFGALRPGDAVNLEPALRVQDRLGGHIVSGHVDGVGEVVSRRPTGRSEAFVFAAPKALMRYIADKGSICIEGISLTVNATAGNQFTVNIVPHTLQETTLGVLKPGHKVNLEVDVVARYLEKLMRGADDAEEGIGMNLLRENGFAH